MAAPAFNPKKPGTLVSRSRIRVILGGEKPLSKQRVAQLTAKPDFPRPIDVLDDGRLPIWARSDVEAYAEARAWKGEDDPPEWSVAEGDEGVWFIESATERIGPYPEAEARAHVETLNAGEAVPAPKVAGFDDDAREKARELASRAKP